MPSDDFRLLELHDRERFNHCLLQDPPRTSEITFTNLFMWRHKYRPRWLPWEDCLLVIFQPEGTSPFGLPPIGPGNKRQALNVLAEELRRSGPRVKICRVDEDFVGEHVDPGRRPGPFPRGELGDPQQS